MTGISEPFRVAALYRFCRLDRFEVIDRTTHVPVSSCQFESFTPYTKR